MRICLLALFVFALMPAKAVSALHITGADRVAIFLPADSPTLDTPIRVKRVFVKSRQDSSKHHATNFIGFKGGIMYIIGDGLPFQYTTYGNTLGIFRRSDSRFYIQPEINIFSAYPHSDYSGSGNRMFIDVPLFAVLNYNYINAKFGMSALMANVNYKADAGLGAHLSVGAKFDELEFDLRYGEYVYRNQALLYAGISAAYLIGWKK